MKDISQFEYARRLFASILPEVSVTYEGDTIVIDRFLTIEPAMVRHVRKTLRGSNVVECDGYILSLEDEIAFGINFYQIVREAVLFVVKDKISIQEDLMNAELYAMELEKERIQLALEKFSMNEFDALCSQFLIDPALALENENVVKTLKENNSKDEKKAKIEKIFQEQF
jgi:hypothetical protein